MKIVLVILLLYVVTASVVYRLRHPTLTETQLFFKLPDALLFRK
jgi:hypothetical protein